MAEQKKGSTMAEEPDRIMPLHYFDNNTMFLSITMHAIMVYDEVLDAEKLRSSLEKLISRDTWQRLGARLKKGVSIFLIQATHQTHTHKYTYILKIPQNNGPDLVIPHKFTPSRPAISFTHVTHDMPKASHPSARLIPSTKTAPTDRPTVVGNPSDWTTLCCGENPPTTSNDYIGTDRPLTGLRIVSYTDATIVDLHWLHIAADAMGLKAILENWVLVLKGREDEVPSTHGFEEDPLKDLGTKPTEKFELEGKELSRWGTASYALRNGYTIAVGKKENRTICIPQPFLQQLRKTALKELAAEGVKDPFLTDNDLLTAWFSSLAFAHLEPDHDVTIMQAMSMRKALAPDLLPPEHPYISNCHSFTSHLTTPDSASYSLGLLAHSLRKGITLHSTRPQVEAYWHIGRRSAWPLGPMPVFFGTPSMHHIGFSNWKKARVHFVDFAKACKGEEGRERYAPLYPSFVSQVQGGVAYPEGFIITGEDGRGNYWVEGYRPEGLWRYVETGLFFA